MTFLAIVVIWCSASCLGAIAIGRWMEPLDGEDCDAATALSRFFLVLVLLGSSLLFWANFRASPLLTF